MVLMDYLTEEDLTPDLRSLADIIGIDNVKLLIINLGGISVYIPRSQSLARLNSRYIADNQHKKIKDLVYDTGLAYRTVYKRLGEVKDQGDD